MAQPELCHRAPAAIASADIMAAASSEVNRLSVASRPGFAPTVRLHVAVVAGHLYVVHSKIVHLAKVIYLAGPSPVEV